jgi:hypothetical protein
VERQSLLAWPVQANVFDPFGLWFSVALACIFHKRAGHPRSVLINTPLQRGGGDGGGIETVLTVSIDRRKPFKRFSHRTTRFTALKHGVNEMGCEISGLARCGWPDGTGGSV